MDGRGPEHISAVFGRAGVGEGLSERPWRTAEITAYMRSQDQRPIMTQSESLLQFVNVAYSKPATALNILRETILGRDLFDFAFKEYSLCVEVQTSDA